MLELPEIITGFLRSFLNATNKMLPYNRQEVFAIKYDSVHLTHHIKTVKQVYARTAIKYNMSIHWYNIVEFIR